MKALPYDLGGHENQTNKQKAKPKQSIWPRLSPAVPESNHDCATLFNRRKGLGLTLSLLCQWEDLSP